MNQPFGCKKLLTMVTLLGRDCYAEVRLTRKMQGCHRQKNPLKVSIPCGKVTGKAGWPVITIDTYLRSSVYFIYPDNIKVISGLFFTMDLSGK